MSKLQLAADSTWELNAAAEEISRLSRDALGKLRAGTVVSGLELLLQMEQSVVDLRSHFRHAVHHAECAEAELHALEDASREGDESHA